MVTNGMLTLLLLLHLRGLVISCYAVYAIIPHCKMPPKCWYLKMRLQDTPVPFDPIALGLHVTMSVRLTFYKRDALICKGPTIQRKHTVWHDIVRFMQEVSSSTILMP